MILFSVVYFLYLKIYSKVFPIDSLFKIFSFSHYSVGYNSHNPSNINMIMVHWSNIYNSKIFNFTNFSQSGQNL